MSNNTEKERPNLVEKSGELSPKFREITKLMVGLGYEYKVHLFHRREDGLF